MSTTQTTQSRSHAGHSHGHAHAHGSEYLTSKNKNDAGVRITRIGLFVNLGMAIGKGIGGYAFNSQALIADGFHALTDLVSDFMTLATISWSLRPASSRFPSGYGKVESLGALGVSGLLLFGGIGIGFNALDVLYSQFFLEAAAVHAHDHAEHSSGLFGFLGHSHGHGGVPDLNAAWLAGGSIIVKEWLYRSTMKIARERKSAVLASNAVHHRIDSLTSIVALATIGGAHVIADASWLDPVGGLIISAMVIRAGWSNTKAALLELADITVDNDVKLAVRRAVTRALEGDSAKGIAAVDFGNETVIRDIQGTKSGQNYLVDIELGVPKDFTLQQMENIEEAVRERAGSKVRGVRRVRVKFVPVNDTSITLASDFIDPDVSPRSSPEPEDERDHDHDHDHDHGKPHAKNDGHQHPNDYAQTTSKTKKDA
ncbi:mitochondrial metal transporter [Elasticomyces elasticus]|uniref:Mitochondrial metal transporter n=1 Tax=Exophiala sideris TaxID=1016849 RepID=A0ABR0J8D5_9EURO|nr:mitochondrial metal transporter [Elasticomyces elasticus]KAK5022221.1 mitochondrial metal transporter [Exophiala sideris]KAK5037337.1 mitochondrial metal transporter [Exophiala sideris]KAK5059001.1 mitochondrial metal transporter [Exophiala sideris]KAK5182833.1 mitochondrial metal transporter [Eurotiomycetes sp. CCFEE 6388]